MNLENTSLDGEHFGDSKIASDFLRFKELGSQTLQRFSLVPEDFHPCPGDATSASGFDRHYVYHVAWAARKLKHYEVVHHVDISSFIHFSTVVSAFIPVDYFEFRAEPLELSDFTIGTQDLKGLSFETGSIPSLSCMHVVEHIGLGRYGDDIDPDGDLKAISELKRVVAPGGLLLFVVPCGAQPKICFNAHRIYTLEMVKSYFEEFELLEMSLITDHPDDPAFIALAEAVDFTRQGYGCGCFVLRKRC